MSDQSTEVAVQLTSIAEYSKTAVALAELRERYKGVIFDVTTREGMQTAIKGRAELRSYRVALEKTRVEIKAPALKRAQEIDSEARRITAELLALETPIDDQIKADEPARVQGYRGNDRGIPTGAVLNPGIYKLPMPEYLSMLAFSSGMAHRILTQSPRHAWIDSPWNPNRESEDNAASDLGTVAHDVLLEGGTGIIERIDPNDYPAKNGNIPDGWTNNAIRAARDAARAAGKIPLFPADADAVTAMVEAAHEFLATSELAGVFATGAPEQTIVWQDGATLCKARPDWLNADVCLHVKTTKRSVHPAAFERMAINMGYDVSLAFYARGIERERHLILAIEQGPPYACKLFGLSSAQADISARKVERAINTWATCMKANRWPAYDGSVHYIEPTPWDMAKAEHDMVEAEQFSDDELKDGVPL